MITFPYISKIIVKSFSNHCHLFALVGPLADGTMPTILCGAWPMVLEKSKPIFLAWVVFFSLCFQKVHEGTMSYIVLICLRSGLTSHHSDSLPFDLLNAINGLGPHLFVLQGQSLTNNSNRQKMNGWLSKVINHQL